MTYYGGLTPWVDFELLHGLAQGFGAVEDILEDGRSEDDSLVV